MMQLAEDQTGHHFAGVARAIIPAQPRYVLRETLVRARGVEMIVIAGMSRFVVVEITDPQSAALELYAIASTFGVPIFPVLYCKSTTFGMFSGLSRFRWVNEPILYNSGDDLIKQLEEQVIEPELKKD